MAFINELLESGLPYGMTIEQPKAYDNTVLSEDALNLSPELEELVQNFVLGSIGGGGIDKGVRKLILAMKGKVKGGKLIPQQPFRRGSVIGEPNQAKQSKLDILLNRLKNNPNIGENISNVMKENVKRYKK